MTATLSKHGVLIDPDADRAEPFGRLLAKQRDELIEVLNDAESKANAIRTDGLLSNDGRREKMKDLAARTRDKIANIGKRGEKLEADRRRAESELPPNFPPPPFTDENDTRLANHEAEARAALRALDAAERRAKLIEAARNDDRPVLRAVEGQSTTFPIVDAAIVAEVRNVWLGEHHAAKIAEADAAASAFRSFVSNLKTADVALRRAIPPAGLVDDPVARAEAV